MGGGGANLRVQEAREVAEGAQSCRAISKLTSADLLLSPATPHTGHELTEPSRRVDLTDPGPLLKM